MRIHLTPISRDAVLDYAAAQCNTPAKVRRRADNMRNAHAQWLDACDVCGKAIQMDSGYTAPSIEEGTALYFGPVCYVKLRRDGVV